MRVGTLLAISLVLAAGCQGGPPAAGGVVPPAPVSEDRGDVEPAREAADAPAPADAPEAPSAPGPDEVQDAVATLFVTGAELTYRLTTSAGGRETVTTVTCRVRSAFLRHASGGAQAHTTQIAVWACEGEVAPAPWAEVLWVLVDGELYEARPDDAPERASAEELLRLALPPALGGQVGAERTPVGLCAYAGAGAPIERCFAPGRGLVSRVDREPSRSRRWDLVGVKRPPRHPLLGR